MRQLRVIDIIDPRYADWRVVYRDEVHRNRHWNDSGTGTLCCVQRVDKQSSDAAENR